MPYVGRDLQRGNYLKLDDISSSFDGSTTTFNLTSGGNAFFPGSAFSIIVSLGGVVQEPEAAFQIDRSQIIFATAPSPNDDFFCIVQGVALGVGVPGHNTVNNDQLAKPLSYGDYFRWDSANNRVGINTLLPSTALDVVGSATFSGNVSIGGTLTYEDVANIDAVGIVTARAGIEDKTLTTGHVVFAGTGGRLIGESQLFYDTSNNFLGIGTNTFGRALTIRHAEPRIRLTEDTTGSFSEIYSDDDGHLYLNADAGGNNGGSRILFHTDGNEKVRIRNDGYIGINTTSPSKLVTIKADAPFVRLEAMDGSDKRLDFEVTNVGIATISALQSSQQLSLKSVGGEIRLNSSGLVGIGTVTPSALLNVNTQASGTTDAIVISRDTYGTVGKFINSTGALVIESYKQLILSSDPAQGMTAAGSNIQFVIDSDTKAFLDSSANLGIGTDDPQTALEIGKGHTDPVIRLNDPADRRMSIRGPSANNIASIGTETNHDLIFFTNGYSNERLRITSGGKIGIGEDDPESNHVLIRGSSTVATKSGHIMLTGDSATVGEGPQIVFSESGATTSYAGGYVGFLRTGGNSIGDLVFGTRGTSGDANTVPEERLRITSAGNVDINGAPPWTVSGGNHRNLSISGEGASGSGFLWLGNGTATTNADFDLGRINFMNGGTVVARVIGTTDTSANDDGVIRFNTKKTGQTEAERLRITSGGVVQIGGETANSADIDTSNTKLTIKQSANSAEDGIYIERSGERRGHYIYVGSGLGQQDALCIRSQQLGTDTDVVAIDRGGDVIIGPGNVGINHQQPSAGLHVKKQGRNFSLGEFYDGYNSDTGLGGDSNSIVGSQAGERTHSLILESTTTADANRGASIGFRAKSGTTLIDVTYAAIVGAKENNVTNADPNSTYDDQAKGYLAFYTSNQYAFNPHYGTHNIERLRITSGGNVNIGGNYTQTTYVCEISGAYNKNGLRVVSGAPGYQDPFVVGSSTGGERFRIKGSGEVVPGVDATQDLGTSSLRWRNVYTTDLQLSNENTGGNEIDGTEGNWTLQEGESDIYMINRKTGKKYKMMLQEVS